MEAGEKREKEIHDHIASGYDEIYYVDIEDSSYVSYEVNNIYGQLEIGQSGDDFFGESMAKAPEVVHKQDCDTVTTFLSRDNLISSLNQRRTVSMDYLPFAIIVCDANNLKQINDTKGHVAGDEYIKASANFLCDIFVHSPVFRVGGDEFVIFLRGNDYSVRHELMGKLRSQSLKNQRAGDGVVLASGMSDYIPDKDNLAYDVFDRADKEMYENKRMLKSE